MSEFSRPEEPPANWSRPLLKPIDVKRMARAPYMTILRRLTLGHPRAGVLASIDLAEHGKRHSYRIRVEDWDASQQRLRTQNAALDETSSNICS
jgi:hypothetical protein